MSWFGSKKTTPQVVQKSPKDNLIKAINAISVVDGKDETAKQSVIAKIDNEGYVPYILSRINEKLVFCPGDSRGQGASAIVETLIGTNSADIYKFIFKGKDPPANNFIDKDDGALTKNLATEGNSFETLSFKANYGTAYGLQKVVDSKVEKYKIGETVPNSKDTVINVFAYTSQKRYAELLAGTKGTATVNVTSKDGEIHSTASTDATVDNEVIQQEQHENAKLLKSRTGQDSTDDSIYIGKEIGTDDNGHVFLTSNGELKFGAFRNTLITLRNGKTSFLSYGGKAIVRDFDSTTGEFTYRGAHWTGAGPKRGKRTRKNRKKVTKGKKMPRKSKKMSRKSSRR
jgi:hypothetical protein